MFRRNFANTSSCAKSAAVQRHSKGLYKVKKNCSKKRRIRFKSWTFTPTFQANKERIALEFLSHRVLQEAEGLRKWVPGARDGMKDKSCGGTVLLNSFSYGTFRSITWGAKSKEEPGIYQPPALQNDHRIH